MGPCTQCPHCLTKFLWIVLHSTLQVVLSRAGTLPRQRKSEFVSFHRWFGVQVCTLEHCANCWSIIPLSCCGKKYWTIAGKNLGRTQKNQMKLHCLGSDMNQANRWTKEKPWTWAWAWNDLFYVASSAETWTKKTNGVFGGLGMSGCILTTIIPLLTTINHYCWSLTH